MHFTLPPVTQALIVANVIVFLLQIATGNQLVAPFALWPLGSSAYGYGFELWQLPRTARRA